MALAAANLLSAHVQAIYNDAAKMCVSELLSYCQCLLGLAAVVVTASAALCILSELNFLSRTACSFPACCAAPVLSIARRLHLLHTSR
jgi:hypothetical protein